MRIVVGKIYSSEVLSESKKGGGPQLKRLYRDMLPTSVAKAKSAAWYVNDPLLKQNLSQNWLKCKKILKKSGDFGQNLTQNWADCF